MAVAFVAGNTGGNVGGANTVDTSTFSFTAGTNGVLVVGVSYTTPTSATISSVVLDPAGANVTLTSVASPAILSTRRIQFFYGIAPATIAAKLVRATFSDVSNGSAGIAAAYFTGANQTTPVSDFTSASGNSASPLVTIPGVITGDAAMDIEADQWVGSNTIGSNQTIVGVERTPADNYDSSYKLGANGSAMTWTLGSSALWFTAGVHIVSINSFPMPALSGSYLVAGSAATFTYTPFPRQSRLIRFPKSVMRRRRR